MFLFTIFILYRELKKVNLSAALLFSMAVTNLSVYLVLAPWADATSTSIHWPLSGYMPLLVFTPMAIRETYNWAENKWSNLVATRIIAANDIKSF